MMSRTFKHVYGPIISKRLGRSLGLDIIPFKVCTYDCIYCQLGFTKEKTNIRKEYVNVSDVLNELKQKLSTCPDPDYISIVGSGEPTLNSKIGELIAEIKKISAVPVAVITNGSLLYLEEVRNELMQADLVIPSLDVGDEAMFSKVNQPHKDLSFDIMVDGIAEFTKKFNGQVWLEVLLLSEITDTHDSVKRIAAASNKINPDRVQISTVSRPPADSNLKPSSLEHLETIKSYFNSQVDIIYHTPDSKKNEEKHLSNSEDLIIDLIERHASSDIDIAKGLGINYNETQELLKKLLQDGKITTINKYGKTFYSPNS
ncbi:MAG: radical SAM protein [Alphaproteobacteria bacterium]